LRVALVGLTLLGAACSRIGSVDFKPADAANCPSEPTVGDLPCPVAGVLMQKCQPCHQQPPKNNAPWPLLTYEDTHLQYGITTKLRWQRMSEVIEPGNFPHMPPADHPQLDGADFAILRDWFQRCAPPDPEGLGCDVTDGGEEEDGGVGDAGVIDARRG
jgi:hypothetical protein